MAALLYIAIAPTRSAAQTAHEKLAREVYAELVVINTMDSVGSTTRAAEAMARRFRAAGFPAEDVQVLINPADTSKGNLVVRYRGTERWPTGRSRSYCSRIST
jgi:hypothetical protein